MAEWLGFLRVNNGPLRGKRMRIRPQAYPGFKAPVYTIGHSDACHLHLPDQQVAPLNALIAQHTDGDFYIKPYGDGPTVMLNGEPLRMSQRLNPNDTLKIGRTVLIFTLARARQRPAPAPAPTLPPVERYQAISSLPVKKRHKKKTPLAMSLFYYTAVLFIVVLMGGGVYYASIRPAPKPKSSPARALVPSRAQQNVQQQTIQRYGYTTGSGQATLVMFETDWCQYCKQQRPILNALAYEYSGKLRIIYIDAEDPGNAYLVAQFRVNSYPHLVVLDGDQRQVATYFGLTPDANLRRGINVALSG